MSVTIAIDPNLRIEGNNTLAGFEDLMSGSARDLNDGMHVEVREPESGIVGDGYVVHVDRVRQLIQLSVNWKSLHAVAA